MRYFALLLAAGSLSSTGCSMLIAASGEHLGALPTQTDTRETFGEPVASGLTASGSYDEFRTHRKIAEPWKLIYLTMGNVSTLGFGELIWCPLELSRASYRSVVGQTLRFEYDAAGNVTSYLIDGEPTPWQPGRTPPMPSGSAGADSQNGPSDGESRESGK